MKSPIIIMLTVIMIASLCDAQIVDNLNDVAVWTFNAQIYTSEGVDSALYLSPGYCKRGWFKFQGQPYNWFPLLSDIPPLLNIGGAILEGGVQVADVQPGSGWPYDNPYDDDHLPPYRIPTPIFFDFVSLNPDGDIYWLNSIYGDSITVAPIANENYIAYVLYWAYQQINANVNALEFDEISGGYPFSTSGITGDNPNLGYDDYAIGTANFARRVSVYSIGDSLFWQMPQVNASSEIDSAMNAFDNDATTFWHSDTADSHWIEIDFGRVRTIQQVYLRFPTERILGNFYVVYWDGAAWQDFDPPVFDMLNTDSIRSFLVEPAPAEKVLLFSTDTIAYIAEFQLFGQGFRQFLLARYCSDSGWTPTDSRWETEKLVDLSDTLQCPDATMNSFDYRGYLQAHDWTGNPLGGTVDSTNFLNPPNPLFSDWGTGQYYASLFKYFFGDSIMMDTIKSAFTSSYCFQRQNTIWTSVRNAVRRYADSLGRSVFITTNGSANGYREGADYLLDPFGGPPLLPIYSVPDSLDTLMRHMDGLQTFLNIFRMKRDWALSFMDSIVPVVAFIDFGHQGNLFSHLGGYGIYGYPADEKAEYLRCYPFEMYAAGYDFCFPVREAQFDAWHDTLSDGMPLIEIIKQETDFLNAYKNIYHNFDISDNETLVTVNGIVPFNGAWNILEGRLDSPVNESKVTIAYTYKTDCSYAYLHIINHNWDSSGHTMLPQYSVPVTIPVVESVTSVMIISPDFPDTVYPAFGYEDGTISLAIPTLEYYVVIILDFTDTTKIAEDKTKLPSDFFISVSPNPFNSSCVISGVPEGARVSIYDLQGRVVCEPPIPQRRDLSPLLRGTDPDRRQEGIIWYPDQSISSGLYLVKIGIENGLQVTKRIVYLK